MDVDITKMTENYGERMRRIGLFSFLYGMKSKRQSDKSMNSIDYFDAAVMFLLFLFENMLMRNNKTSIRDISVFFYNILSQRYDIDENDCYKMAETLLHTFRPPTGNRPSFTFYNQNSGREETVHYNFIKRQKADISGSTQYFALDEDGLELIFATKEYFSEFHISINQLLIRKQLEKGEFVGALRQIDEMHIEVMALKERIIKIKHEVQRNIISNETYARYRSILGDISARLKRENTEFGELISYVAYVQNKFGHDIEMLNEKDCIAYKYILRIDMELDKVHHEHKKLLDESLKLQKSALQSAGEALYYAGVESFNFNKEITAALFSLPLPAMEGRLLVEPFLFLKRQRAWNPLRLLAPQKIDSPVKEKAERFLEPLSNKELLEYMQRQSKNFERIMRTVLEIMDGRFEITLSEVIVALKDKNDPLLNERIFYDFFLILHQKSPISGSYDGENPVNLLFSGIFRAVGRRIKKLVITEKRDIIKASDSKDIQNMLICLEEK